MEVRGSDQARTRQRVEESQRQTQTQEKKAEAKKQELRDSVERTKDAAPTAPVFGSIAPANSIKASAFQLTDFSSQTGGANRSPVRRVDPIHAVDIGGNRPNQPTRAEETRRSNEAVPEDFSARGGNFLMTYTGQPHQAHFIKRMGEIGRKEGFGVVAAANSPENAAALRKELGPSATNVRVINQQNYPWPEDSVHTKKDGSVTLNPTITNPKVTEQLRSRLSQIEPGDHSKLSYNELAAKLREHGAAYGLNGAAGTGSQESADSFRALGRKMFTGTTYTEGGNVIHTTRNGEVHAIVGIESVRHNELLTGKKDEELRRAMAADLGVKPENLHVVRQPGEFHLDMAMTAWGEGRVLLNDSRMAAEAQIKAQGLDGERAETLRREAETRAKYEEQTRRDLEAAGFEVVPVAGRFFEGHHRNGEAREIANFLNGEAGQNRNGGNYFITQRGEPAFERAFAGSLPQDIPVRLYFAFDRDATRASLSEFAGANCLVKRFY